MYALVFRYSSPGPLRNTCRLLPNDQTVGHVRGKLDCEEEARLYAVDLFSEERGALL